MNKLSKIFLIIIIVLVMLLGITINRWIYFSTAHSKAVQDNIEIIKELNEASDEIESLKKQLQK